MKHPQPQREGQLFDSGKSQRSIDVYSFTITYRSKLQTTWIVMICFTLSQSMSGEKTAKPVISRNGHALMSAR